jgi:steroid delta-isomerase-like uncharacterized protein
MSDRVAPPRVPGGATAPEARNKQLVRRMHAELLESRDPGRVEEFFAPDFVSHNMPPGFPAGVEGVRCFLEAFAIALPDLTVTIDVLVAEDDLVAVRTTTRGTHRGRFMGVRPTGRRLAIDGTDIVRLQDGRIVEHWGLTNTVGLLRQVGPLGRFGWLWHQLAGLPARRAARDRRRR